MSHLFNSGILELGALLVMPKKYPRQSPKWHSEGHTLWFRPHQMNSVLPACYQHPIAGVKGIPQKHVVCLQRE